ncbi:MAG: biosynthetic peptidoglycan transglycosylase [bacterium]
MKLKTVGIIAAIVAFFAVLAAFALPILVEDAVEGELRERLSRAGLKADWDGFSSRLGRSFRLTRVKIDIPDRGIHGEIDEILVAVSVESLLDKKVSIRSVDVSNAVFRVDIDAVDSGVTSDAAAGVPATKSSTLRRLLESPPEITISGGSVAVVRGDDELLLASTTKSQVELSWNELSLKGDLRVEPKIPLAAKVGESIRSTVSASYDLKTQRILASLVSEEPDRPLVSWDVQGLGALRVGELGLVADLQSRHAEMAIDLLSVRVGPDKRPLSTFDAPTVQVAYRDGRPAITATNGRAAITPSQRALIGELFHRQTSQPTSVKPRTGGRSLVQKVSRLLGRTDFAFQGLRVDVNLEDEHSDDLTRLTLIERVDGTANLGRLNAVGTSAGGTFRVDMDTLPGESIPRYLSVDIDKVDLANIPGMPKGRSELPSRGTSGRVGGVLSASLLWQMPPKGSALGQLYDAATGSYHVIWENGVVDLVGVSDEPLTGIKFSSHADFVWRPQLGKLSVLNGKLDWGPVDISYNGYLEDFRMDPTFFVRAEMAEIECQRAIRSLPAGMLGPYRNIEFEGEWAPSVEFYLPIWRPRALRLEFDGYEDLCRPTALNVPKQMRPETVRVLANAPTGPHRAVQPDAFEGPILSDVFWLNRPFIKRVVEGVSSEEVEVNVGPGMASYVPLEALPPWVGGAAYLSEEMMFYTDAGISLGLIKKALRLNLEKGRFVYGGSTVTQQLIKNLFLTRDKTLARKLQEALLAWRITNEISKDRVLELYLNCIEFGPDIYGIGPAARYYFQKDARNLSPLEAIFLAMLKPNPLYGGRVIQRRKTPMGGWWSNRMDEMFGRLLERNLITAAQVESEKPYVLEWDANGRYIDRKKSIIPLLPP